MTSSGIVVTAVGKQSGGGDGLSERYSSNVDSFVNCGFSWDSDINSRDSSGFN